MNTIQAEVVNWTHEIDIDTVLLVNVPAALRQKIDKIDWSSMETQNAFYLRKFSGEHHDPTMIHTHGDPARFNVGDAVSFNGKLWVIARKREAPFGKPDTVLYHIHLV